MTVVVWDGTYLAADPLGIRNGKAQRVRKVRKLQNVMLTNRLVEFTNVFANRATNGNLNAYDPEGYSNPREILVGYSGTMSNAEAFFDWAASGFHFKDFPVVLTENSTALVVFKEQDNVCVLRFEDSMYPVPVLEKSTAIGYGVDMALMALLLGKGAVESVKLCAQLSPFVRLGNGSDVPLVDYIGFSKE